MAGAFERLRQVALFDGLSDDDLARICTDVSDVHLDPGDELFVEGDPGDRAYVITSGDVEILKTTARRDVLLALRRAGEVIGEMALIEDEPRIATARARSAVELISIPRRALDELLNTSPQAARAIFNTFLDRLRATNDQLRQSERLVQLGTLTAGVAHELNNPASAIARASEVLAGRLDTLVELAATPSDADARAAVLALLDGDRAAPTDALSRSDAESDLEDWLSEHGVAEPWELAADLVDAGITAEDLEPLVGAVSGPDVEIPIRTLAAALALREITQQIAEAAGRMSSIVGGLKDYTYLDQAPVQDVDVHAGLDATLALLAHKTKHVHVVREYADDLPTITALGTELNQVWTNLIDNACDALQGIDEPTLTLRTMRDDDMIAVEVADNGPGIPEDIQDQIFDAFFTTKPPGEGTGLGLQISWRIVVLEHGGDLIVTSQPGETTFRVTLPLEPPVAVTAGQEDPMAPETCEHLDALQNASPPDYADGCPDCVAMGSRWVHLRYCDSCGKAGCCDDSPNRHARAHAESTDHKVFRSLEPGDSWAWCVADDMGVRT